MTGFLPDFSRACVIQSRPAHCARRVEGRTAPNQRNPDKFASFEEHAMAAGTRSDLSHLMPSTAEEIRAMAQRAGLDLPDELMRQFIAAWPNYEAMVRRLPRRRSYGEEPAHIFRPARLFSGR
jgi:hypothetical protein